MSAPPPKNTTELSPEFIAYSNAPTLFAQTSSFFTIAILVVIGRCYTRACIVKSFGRDDFAMLAAQLFATITFICYTIQISLGVGKHMAVIQADEAAYRQILRVRQIHMVSVVVGISLVKISVSLFLLRLSMTRAYSWFLWGVIAFLASFTLACMGTLIFQCVPVVATWDIRLRPPPRGTGTAKCFSVMTFSRIGLFNGIINIITDFLLALLPVPLIWTLQMPFRTRLTLVLILSLGIFASFAGIIRQLKVSQFRDPEPWIQDSYAIWNFIELYSGITAASLPSLRPLLRGCMEGVRGMSSSERVNSTGMGGRTGDLGGQGRIYVRSDGFAMRDYEMGRQKEVSSCAEESDADGVKSSEENILPRYRAEGKPGAIRVTRRVQVE